MRDLRVVPLALLVLLAVGCAPKRVQVYDHLTITEMRRNLIETALSFHGKPYRNGAKGPDTFDCSGFVYHVFKIHGIVVPVSTEGLQRAGSSVPKESLLPGDLVLFKRKRDFHVGIMLNAREFIHASTSRGITVDDINTPYWKAAIQGFRSVL